MKASFVLTNGTKVEIDGTPVEVQQLLSTYSGGAPMGSTSSGPAPAPPAKSKTRSKTKAKAKPKVVASTDDDAGGLSELELVNHIKEDERFEWLDRLLDAKDMTIRVMLVLFVAAEVDPQAPGLTSGFIARVHLQLGVRLDVSNVSKELSGRGKKYVLADVVRRKGAPVHYKLSRVGRAFMEQQRDGKS
jgi:hypothetical protein